MNALNASAPSTVSPDRTAKKVMFFLSIFLSYFPVQLLKILKTRYIYSRCKMTKYEVSLWLKEEQISVLKST